MVCLKVWPVTRISAAPVWARNLFAVSYIAYEEEKLADISQNFNFCSVTESKASVPRSPTQASFYHLFC